MVNIISCGRDIYVIHGPEEYETGREWKEYLVVNHPDHRIHRLNTGTTWDYREALELIRKAELGVCKEW